MRKKGCWRKKGAALLCALALLAGNVCAESYVWAKTPEEAAGKTTGLQEASDSDVTKDSVKTLESGKTGDSDNKQEPGKTGDTDKEQEPGKTGDTDKKQKPGKTGDSDNKQEPGETGDTDKEQEPGETGDTDKKQEPGETGDTDKEQESGETGDADREQDQNEEDSAKEEELEKEEEELEGEMEEELALFGAAGQFDISFGRPDGCGNVALGKSVSASSSYEMSNEGWQRSNLTDGILADGAKPSYGWTTNPYDGVTDPKVPAEVTVDLGEEYDISGMTIFPRADDGHFGEAFPVDFQVKISKDKGTWTEVCTVTGMETPAEPVAITLEEAEEGRYVQIYVSRRAGADSVGAGTGNDGKLVQFSELAVWGAERAPEMDYLKLDRTSVRLRPGQTASVTAEAKVGGEDAALQWSTDDEAVATVDENGLITAVAVGTTLIHARVAAEGMSEEMQEELHKTVEVVVTDSTFRYDDNILISAFWPPTLEYMGEDDARWDEQYELLQKAGINLINNVTGNDLNAKETNLKMLDYADKYGMVVSVADNRFGANLKNLSAAKISDLLGEYRDKPGLGGYYILDEPGNPNEYIGVYEAMKQADPDMYMHLNFLPMPAATKNQMRDYVRLSEALGYPQDYLMYDLYPYPDNSAGMNREGFYNNMRTVWEVGRESNVKTATYLQSICIPGAYRCPSVAEIRYEAMMALAYGYKQVSYFAWFTPSNRSEPFEDGVILLDGTPNPKTYDGICELNEEIHGLGKVLIHLDAEEVYFNGTTWGQESIPADFFVQPADNADYTVSLLRNQSTGQNYLMVVNNLYDRAATVTLKPDRSISGFRAVNRKDGSLESIAYNAQGNLELNLEAGDGVLLALPEGLDFHRSTETEQNPGENLAAGAYATADTSLGAGGWYIANLTDGVRGSKDDSNGWRSADNREKAQITLDLGQTRKFNRADLYAAGSLVDYGEGMPKDFEIQVSENGTSYTTVATVEGFGADGMSGKVEFEEQEARYIRFVISASNGGGLRLAELEVFLDDGTVPDPEGSSLDDGTIVDYTPGENIALNKKVYVSSTTSGAEVWGWSVNYVNDGVKDNGWTSMTGLHPIKDGPDVEEWVMIDLGDQFAIEKVLVWPKGTFPKEYRIEISGNGRDGWESIGSDKQQKKDKWITFNWEEKEPKPTGRFIRMTGTKLGYDHERDGYTMQVGEIKAYGKPIVEKEAAEQLLEEAAALCGSAKVDVALLQELADELAGAVSNENVTQSRLNDWCKKVRAEMAAVKAAEKAYEESQKPGDDKDKEDEEKPDDTDRTDQTGDSTGGSGGSGAGNSAGSGGSGAGNTGGSGGSHAGSNSAAKKNEDTGTGIAAAADQIAGEQTDVTPSPTQNVRRQQPAVGQTRAASEKASVPKETAEPTDAEAKAGSTVQAEGKDSEEPSVSLEEEETPLAAGTELGRASDASSKTGFIGIAVMLAVIALAAVIWWFFRLRRGENEEI